MSGHAIARTALIANAAFCAICGLVLALEGGAGLSPHPAGDLVARVIGVGLVLFAPLVAWVALRRLSAATALLITASDVAWVLASLAALGLGGAVLTAAGVAAIAGIAAATLLFASGQALGAARMS